MFEAVSGEQLYPNEPFASLLWKVRCRKLCSDRPTSPERRSGPRAHYRESDRPSSRETATARRGRWNARSMASSRPRHPSRRGDGRPRRDASMAEVLTRTRGEAGWVSGRSRGLPPPSLSGPPRHHERRGSTRGCSEPAAHHDTGLGGAAPPPSQRAPRVSRRCSSLDAILGRRPIRPLRKIRRNELRSVPTAEAAWDSSFPVRRCAGR